MATLKLNSLKGRRIRVTRLDSCGVPVVGACSSVVSSGFITVEFTPEVESGEEFLQKNAWGDACVSERDGDYTKWTNVALTLCEVDPDILDIVADGSPALDALGTDTIGVTFGSSVNTSAFALEVWTKQAGVCVDGTQEWGYFVAPFVTNGKIDGGVTIERGVLNMSMVGEAQDAPADWGVNPYGDNPMLDPTGFPTGEQWGVVRTTVQPPAESDGCAAVS